MDLSLLPFVILMITVILAIWTFYLTFYYMDLPFIIRYIDLLFIMLTYSNCLILYSISLL